MLVTHVNNGPKGRNVINNVRNFWPISNGTLFGCDRDLSVTGLCNQTDKIIAGTVQD
jgi:hypothetical protein